jgi:hypothetical protein
MPAYERVDNGEVVETVITVDGSTEDTRLGVAALEGTGGWRQAEPEPPPAPAAEPESEPEPDGD